MQGQSKPISCSALSVAGTTTSTGAVCNSGTWRPYANEVEMEERIQCLRDTATALEQEPEHQQIEREFEERYRCQNQIHALIAHYLAESDRAEHENKNRLRLLQVKAADEVKTLHLQLDQERIRGEDVLMKLRAEAKALDESVNNLKVECKLSRERAQKANTGLSAATAAVEKVKDELEVGNQTKIKLSNQVAELSGQKSSNIMGKAPTKAEFTAHLGQFTDSSLPVMLDAVLSNKEPVSQFITRLRACLQDSELVCTQLTTSATAAAKCLAGSDSKLQTELNGELHRLILQNWDSFVATSAGQLVVRHQFSVDAARFLIEAKLWPLLFQDSPDFHLIHWSSIGAEQPYCKAKDNLLEEWDMKNRLKNGEACTVVFPGLYARDREYTMVHKAAVLPAVYGIQQ